MEAEPSEDFSFYDEIFEESILLYGWFLGCLVLLLLEASDLLVFGFGEPWFKVSTWVLF